MKKFFKMFGAVGLLAGMMMLVGCGDDATPAVATKSAQPLTNATVVAGTVTVATASTASTPAGATALTIPAGSTFTGTKADGTAITTAPTVSVSTPTSGVSGMTQPTSGSTSFTVQSAAGAVDITFDGLTSATFSGAGTTVTIPVSPALTVGSTVSVLVVKANGASSVKSGTVNAGGLSVNVANVTNFCGFYVNPVLRNPSGTTGSINGFNIH
jgi:hypothetical protein